MLDEYFTRCSKLKKITNYIESPLVSRKLKPRPKDAVGSGEAVIREIKQIHNTNYDNELRAELLGTDKTESSATLRKRATGISGSSGGGENMGQAMKYYGDVQERIAEDMLSLTRSLKEQTETANRIIKRDTEVTLVKFSLNRKN